MIPRATFDRSELDSSARLVLAAFHAVAEEAFAQDPTASHVDLVVRQSDVAARAGVSRASVRRALPVLRRLGLIERTADVVG